MEASSFVLVEEITRDAVPIAGLASHMSTVPVAKHKEGNNA